VAGITPLSASPLSIFPPRAAFGENSDEVADTDSAILPIND
jgi:hypothetical protein